MNNVFEKDGTIYFEFKVYSMGVGPIDEIIKVQKKDINYIEQYVGPRGGDHGWAIIGFEPDTTGCHHSLRGNYGPNEKCKELKSFWRDRTDLLDMLITLTGVKVKEITIQS